VSGKVSVDQESPSC